MKINIKRQKSIETYREIFSEKFGEIETLYYLFPKTSFFKVKKEKFTASSNMLRDEFMEKNISLTESFDSEILSNNQLIKIQKYLGIFIEHLTIFFGL